MVRFRLLPLVCLLLLLCASSVAPGASSAPPKTVPLVYSSDLLHPHDDPDDHFDLATLFALRELDVRAILLDLGAEQAKRSGKTPVEQMLRLTGRRVPYAAGLPQKLKSSADNGREQPAEFQGAVDLLLQVLREAKQPVTYIGTGSTRDLVAAFNREPRLLKEKLGRVYVVVGNASDGEMEWNVNLDPHAFVGLMRSGLPVYWCPCFPIDRANTNSLYASFWKFRQDQVLETAPQPLQNFFIYALQRVRPDELDPQQALETDLRPWCHLVWQMERNMWSTAALLHAAGREVYRTDKGWVAAAIPPPGAQPVSLFTFIPARVDIDNTGKTTKRLHAPDTNLRLLQVTDPEHFSAAMGACLQDLFRHFPLTEPFAKP